VTCRATYIGRKENGNVSSNMNVPTFPVPLQEFTRPMKKDLNIIK
jgi:hypothetical protein